jgi:predicted peroxiredoxin
MATIVYFSTHGSDDPTRATIPFFLASGALEAGHQPQIILGGEAPYVMKAAITEQVRGIGVPPLKELLVRLVEHEVPIYV